MKKIKCGSNPNQTELFRDLPKANSPSGPYILGPKSKYPGKALELLLFQKFSYIETLLYRSSRGEINPIIKKHLDWLMAEADKLAIAKMCPFCGKRPIELFALGPIVAENRTCCSNQVCIEQLKSDACYHDPLSVTVMPLRFSNLKTLDEKVVQAIINKVFRPALNLPKRLSMNNIKQIFQLFTQQPYN